jgi:TSC-22/dip/bun family.
MAPITEKIAKYAGMAAGLAEPYVEKFIDSRKKITALKEDIKELTEKNITLKKENASLKKQLFISGIIAAFALILFIIISIVHFLK